MRITMLAASVGTPFGQERVLALSAQALRTHGFEIEVIADHVHAEVPQASRTTSIAGFSSLQPFSSRAKVAAVLDGLHRELGRFRPDVIHFLDFVDERLLLACASVAPTVLTAHTVAPTCPASTRQSAADTYCERKSGYRCLAGNYRHHCLDYLKSDLHRTHAVYGFEKRKRAYKKHLARIAAISPFVEQCLLRDGWAREQVCLVPNPVPIPQELGAKDASSILVCSRLTPLKAVDTVLHAAARLQDIHRANFRITVCGDGSERTRLEQLANKLGIENRVRWMGQQSPEAVAMLMKNHAIFVQANRGPEAFGMAAAEAMAWGCAPVVSNVPALSALVVDGKTGLIFEKDSPQSCAEKLNRLLSEPALCKTLSTQARQFAQSNFSVKTHVDTTLHLYKSASLQLVTKGSGSKAPDSKRA